MKLKTENPVNYTARVVDFRKNAFAKIESGSEDRIWLKASLKDVKKIVIILSAPRSGSSLLFAILRKIPRIYSLSGESSCFFRLNGLSSDVFPSDEIPDRLDAIDNNLNISRDFLSDFSGITNQKDIRDDADLLNQYIDDLALRFSMQWPLIDFRYNTFRELTLQALKAYWKTHKGFSKEGFYLELLSSLRTVYDAINPYYYDMPEHMVKKKFPDIKVPSGPPNDILMIEEPPFILLSPEKKVNKDDLSNKILLLKTTVNNYRINYIKNIFPNADIKIIYLMRNPLASINGLYDGWLYRGFFSHNLKKLLRNNKAGSEGLKISGYSDRYPWGKWWWNYDLPPGWEDYTERRLEEVCAFQWHSANQAIQKHINNAKIKAYQTTYENIVRDLKSRTAEIGKIIDFMGLPQHTIKRLDLDRLPVVQAIQAPRPYRWKKRRDILLSLLSDPKISSMHADLGYEKERAEEWL